MTPYDTHLETCRLYAKIYSKRIQALVDKSKRLVEEFLSVEEYQPCYVGLSGGKDSTVMYSIVQSVAPVDGMWFDNGTLAIPDTGSQIDQLQKLYNAKIYRVFADDWHLDYQIEYGRLPNVEFPRTLDYQAETTEMVIRHFGFKGAFVGIRGVESKNRAWAVKKKILKYKSNYYAQMARCVPIGDWGTMDVWAYMVANNLPIHSAYEKMMNLGASVAQARVDSIGSPGAKPVGGLSLIPVIYPEAWSIVLKTNPYLRID